MKWYRKLYIGENAKKDKYKVFGHIRKNGYMFTVLYFVQLRIAKVNLVTGTQDSSTSDIFLTP